jgi:hypothetical protein
MTNGSSELRRSAYASLLVAEVLTNLANHELENVEGLKASDRR